MNEWIDYLDLEPASLNVARQHATIVGAIAAANGVTIDEDKLLAAWGFAANEPPPQTQDEANRRLKAAWG